MVIAAFDDVPEHLFRVYEVHDDLITGVALTGPLKGSYAEPSIEQIIRIEPKRLGSR